MDIEQIKAIIQDHESRLRKLEGINNSKDSNNYDHKQKSLNYSGLSGGIQMLLDDGFFNTPKSLAEVTEQLKLSGYYYAKTAVNKTLSVDFMKRDRKMTRIKEGNVYKYVVRK